MTDAFVQESDQTDLSPKGWTTVVLDEIAEVITGNTPSKKDEANYGRYLPLVKPGELLDAPVAEAEDNLSEKGAQSARVLPPNSVLVSCIGNLGKTAISRVPVAFNQQINAAVFSEAVIPKFGFYYLQTGMVKNWMEEHASATTVTILNKGKFSKLPFPVAPLNEQRRIVEKIEELFTKLDAGVRSLKQTQAQLKSYRRSVLKAAVEGELSREWREAHRGEIEPASDLLERILQERREKFGGKKYKEPASPDTLELPALPGGWEWVRLDSLASIKGGITKDNKRRYEHSRIVPYLRVANVQRGYLDLSELKEIEASEDVIEQLLLEPGDVLFTEGGDRDKLGRGWIWNGEVTECIHQNHIFRARLYSADVEPKFVSWFGNTFGQLWFMQQGKQTTNLASINLTKLSAFPVPLPPLEEQRFIVEEVDRRLSVVDKLEETVEANLKQAGGLRQSILKQAFSGKLVPQDPDDEPASVLLERIRQERQATKQKASKKNVRARQKVSAGDQALELFPKQGE